jgi:signal transduction histidine kinase
MARSLSKHKASFLWQAALILLPLAVLVIVGLVSLRQDRLLAQHEAAERAQGVADDLLPRVWAELMSTNYSEPPGYHSFEVNAAGELEFPRPYSAVPAPAPFDEQQLTVEQMRLWRKAQTLEMGANRAQARDEAIREYQQFIGLRPPEQFSAAAHYAVGLLLLEAGGHEAAVEAFRSLVQNFPNAVAASGIPFRPLAEFKLLELMASKKPGMALTNELTPQQFFQSVVMFPTFLTPQFIEHAGDFIPIEQADKWKILWEEQEFSRQLFSAASRHFQLNKVETTQTLEARLGYDWPRGKPDNPELAFFWFDVANEIPQATRAQAGGLAAFDAQEHKWLAIRVGNTIGGTSSPSASGSGDSRSRPVAAVPNVRYLVAMADPGRLQPTNAFVEPSMAAKSNQPPANFWFICRSESDIRTRLVAAIKETRPLPEYFGLGIQVAGRDFYFENAGSLRNKYLGDLASNFLASAYCSSKTEFRPAPDPAAADWIKSGTGWNPDNGSTVRANVYLTNPSALFRRQHVRTLWFGCLIAVSAGTALLGLTAAWRAFERQQRLSDLKSNFVSSVSHELRAPIATVRLLAESLERGKVSDAQKQEEYFRFIGQECRRLSALVENVLDFSRIEQGRKQYEFEPTDIVALVRATVALMQTYAVEKGVTVALDLRNLEGRTSQLELCVDGRAIQQALVNLVDNAIKHSPKGEKVTVGIGEESVECRVSSEEAGAAPRHSTLDTHPSLVTLSVEDHGPGIPPEEHQKIFERFYRVGPELRRETQGVGIGLSIVKHIVEAHGGRVVVRSAVGQGSRFTIELPQSANS